MIFLVVTVLIIGGAYVVGKLTEGPTTLETIKASTSDIAFGQLCGKDPKKINQFRLGIVGFHGIYKLDQPETWEDIKDMAVGAIPPIERGGRQQVANLVGQIEGMGKDYARDHHLNHEDQPVQDAIVEAAITGLLQGAKDAKDAEGQNCLPSMLVR